MTEKEILEKIENLCKEKIAMVNKIAYPKLEDEVIKEEYAKVLALIPESEEKPETFETSIIRWLYLQDK